MIKFRAENIFDRTGSYNKESLAIHCLEEVRLNVIYSLNSIYDVYIVF